MAGPIRSFIDTLQERQPLRNALRGAFGLPQRRSTIINSFDEMAARDREMGGDISAAMPAIRPPARVATTATTGPAAAAALPAPQEAPGAAPVQAQAIDPTQPYRGMGMMQAIVTPPSAALRQQRGVTPAMGVSQQAAGGSGVSPLHVRIREVSQSQMTPAEKSAAMRDLFYTEASLPGLHNDRVSALVRMGDSYAKLGAAERAMELGGSQAAAARQAAADATAAITKATQDAIQSEKDQIDRAADAQIRVNTALSQTSQNAIARSAAIADEVGPLKADPTLPIAALASAARTSMAQQNAANKTPNPAAEEMEYQRFFDRGLAFRINEAAARSSRMNGVGRFGRGHPNFHEAETHYRSLIAANPQSYQQVLDKVKGIVAASVTGELTQEGKPGAAIQRYIEGVAQDIVGPPPVQQGFFTTARKAVFGE